MKTILCSRGQTHAGSCSNPAQKWTKAIHSTKARKNGVDWILIFSIALAKDEQGRISPLINRLSQRIPYFTRWQNKMQSRVDHAPHRNVDALVLLPTFLKKKDAKICCMNDSERSRPSSEEFRARMEEVRELAHSVGAASTFGAFAVLHAM